MGSHVDDGGLLDPTGPTPNNWHLFTHNYITRQFVMGSEGECIDIDFKLVQLTHLMAVARSHSSRKIGSDDPGGSQ